MSGESYKPAFNMTDEIANLIIEIGEYVGQISAHDTLSTNLYPQCACRYSQRAIRTQCRCKCRSK